MVTGRAKVDSIIKGDSLLTVHPVCLYGLILTPTAAIYGHVKRTIYIKGEGQIPQGSSINPPALFRTGAA